MGIFGKKRIKKVEKRKLPPPKDTKEIKPPGPPQTPKTGPGFMQPIPNLAPRLPPKRQPSLPQVPPPKKTSLPPARPPQEQRRPVGKQGKREGPPLAPLFIKLTRYRKILDNMNYLKMSINLVRHQLAVLSELDRLKSENMKMLQSTMKKVGERLIKLDSEFMRPTGFVQDMPEMHIHELESLENTITDLRSQIEGLKHEIDSLS